MLDYTVTDRLVPMARGFLNVYSGDGYEKLIKINTEDEDFFRKMFKEQIMDVKWLEMGSTLSIIISVYVYNPNLYIVDEQRIVIEFLETGGLINLGHESLLINMKLYRDTSQYL
jgi:hypothetical protein